MYIYVYYMYIIYIYIYMYICCIFVSTGTEETQVYKIWHLWETVAP